MRLKCHLSIINNERNADFWADADSGALEESTTWENTWLNLQPGLYRFCATRRRSQTLTTREEESFIRLLNRAAAWTAQEVLFTRRIACITSPSPHPTQSQYSTAPQ